MAGVWPAAWGRSWGMAWGGAWGQSGSAQASQVVEVDSPQVHTGTPAHRWYVRRGRQILLFDTGADADAWLAAQDRADQEVQQAQKTSRRARKRLRERITVHVCPPRQTLEAGALEVATRQLGLAPDLGTLLERRDWHTIATVHDWALAQRAADAARDEEEVALLLLA